MTKDHLQKGDAGPWNPGIKSTLPSEYLPLSTMFRPENVFTSVETASELSDFTGLPVQQLVFFRPERLIIHELLIRVSADIFVSDGSKYEDLGVNFRAVVDTILAKYIHPEMDHIVGRFYQLKSQVEALVEQQLEANLTLQVSGTDEGESKSIFAGLFKLGRDKTKAKSVESVEMRDQRILANWRGKAQSSDDNLSRVLYSSLVKTCHAIIIKYGRLRGENPLLKTMVTGFTCNQYGSELIGQLIAPYITEAATQEGYRLLPPQTDPVVINIKGASASGKSTMRPMQQKQTEKLGSSWQDFALISPDIWRKYLLDYDSLGSAYKYAGTLAGDEIPIIDQKLDSYISTKAEQHGISHLLIDRFRFDSFAHGHDAEEGSNLLTRFGHTVYLTFMVTPPEATVERAWKRGLQVGRYKSVDDLLDHNIEAFRGMPVLFFTWVLRDDKRVLYEFLDNSVEKGEVPRTIAFGFNNEMFLLDFKCMFDIVRYTKININATCMEQVYPQGSAMDGASNTDFLIKCANRFKTIHFVDRASGKIYAGMESSKITWVDPDLIDQVMGEENSRIGFQAIAPNLIKDIPQLKHDSARPVPIEASRHLMGSLG